MKRQPYPGIHPIISIQTLTPLHTLARFYRKDPDIAVSCETTPGPSKHRSGCSQSAIRWITGPSMEELEKIPKELKGFATLQVEQQYELPSTPQSSCVQLHMYQEMAQSAISGKRGPLVVQTLSASVQGNARAKKWEWMGDFWDSIGNVNEINT